MICHLCGKSNDDKNEVCEYCGAIFENQKSLLTAMAGNSLLGQKSLGDMLGNDESLSDILEPIPDDTVPLLDGADVELQSVEPPLLDDDAIELVPAETQKSLDAQGDDDAIELVPADTQKTLDAAADAQKRRFCTQCGTEIADGNRFCGACGARYEESGLETHTEVPSRIAVSSGTRVSVEKANFLGASPKSAVQNARYRLFHLNDDGSEGEEIPLVEGENDIGRISSLTMRSDHFVSPLHCHITCKQDDVILEDAQSLNGVFVRINGASIQLQDGDQFRIGEELLTFVAGSSTQVILTACEDDNAVILGGKELPGWGYLRVIMGAYTEGSVYRLVNRSVTLGRTRSNIRFDRDSFVSGLHAMVSNDGGRFILSDLDSSNGTFYRINTPIRLQARELVFLIGNQLMKIEAKKKVVIA